MGSDTPEIEGFLARPQRVTPLRVPNERYAANRTEGVKREAGTVTFSRRVPRERLQPERQKGALAPM